MIWRTLWSRSRVHDSSASDPPRSKFNLHVGSITETANATPTAQSCRDFRTPINDIREAQLSATSIGTGDYFRSSIASIDPKWPVWSPYRAKYKRSFAHQCGNWLAVLARQEELSLQRRDYAVRSSNTGGTQSRSPRYLRCAGAWNRRQSAGHSTQLICGRDGAFNAEPVSPTSAA